MPDEKADPNVWRWICAILAGMIVTGGASWLSFGNTVSRKDLDSYIEVQGPYVRDRPLLMDTLSNDKKEIADLALQCRNLAIEQAKLITRLDQISREYRGSYPSASIPIPRTPAPQAAPRKD